MAPHQQEWTIAHLDSNVPEAAQYVHDEWDASTFASTPSVKNALSSPTTTTTILRDSGTPCTIIISTGRKIGMSKRVIQKLWHLIKRFLEKYSRDQRQTASEASTVQPSLGVNGVIVWWVFFFCISCPVQKKEAWLMLYVMNGFVMTDDSVCLFVTCVNPCRGQQLLRTSTGNRADVMSRKDSICLGNTFLSLSLHVSCTLAMY